MSKFTTSSAGIALIKKFEGCKLTAYKAVSTEKYYTIAYGHYGSDVTKGMTITQAQADAYLKADLAKFEGYVNAYNLTWMNQARFDALVSFSFNCGAGNLKTLLNNGKRTASEVSAHITAYNKSGGKVLAGLTKRRQAEKTLFDSASTTTSSTTTCDVNGVTLYKNEDLVGDYKLKDAYTMRNRPNEQGVAVATYSAGQVLRSYGWYVGEYAFMKNESTGAVGYINGNHLKKV